MGSPPLLTSEDLANEPRGGSLSAPRRHASGQFLLQASIGLSVWELEGPEDTRDLGIEGVAETPGWRKEAP
ncbi:MAG: hypothetical protein L6R30_19800 [Thermoanaerobaculia bacterium]|nr:hypothetical protein [Thermoanaerobaculia bacterium]